jgi:hypothetical protein
MPYTVRWPDAENHEILPNLFIGGHQWAENVLQARDSRHSKVSSDPSWDYVVSAYVTDSEASWPQCDHRLVLFGDTEKGLSEETWGKIRSAVDAVVSRWKSGQKVLVRCQSGYNRSGLLMALALMRLGYTAEAAISLVRERRGQDVLINSVFERYVYEREDEYHVDPEGASSAKVVDGPGSA